MASGYGLSWLIGEEGTAMDVMTPSQRHQNMKRIRSTDTRAEVMLRRALWHRGLRYRKNWRGIPGTPDIVLTRQKIAIFVDGDFWHARGHQDHPGEQVATRRAFWEKKLSRNVERDREINDELTQLGWLVLRFWETDIKKDLAGCMAEIDRYL